jgi:threonine dehydrogenase-like Zn-dependent dehydrogenase
MVGVVEALAGEHPEVKIGELALVIAPEQAAMAEYYLAPFNNVIPIPAGIDPKQLVQAQQLGTVIYGCQQLPNLIGKDVAVVGQGSAGLWFNFMAKRMGARRVIGIDLQQHRLAYSRLYGATDVVWNGENAGILNLLENPPHIVIEAAGDPTAINLAIDLVQDDGFILQFGVPHVERFEVDYYKLFRKCAHLKPIVFASREPNHRSTRMALAMIANGEIDVAPILTHTFPFDHVPKAYALQATRDAGNVKILIDMVS